VRAQHWRRRQHGSGVASGSAAVAGRPPSFMWQKRRRHTKPSNIDLIFMDVMCCDVGMMAQTCVRA